MQKVNGALTEVSKSEAFKHYSATTKKAVRDAMKKVRWKGDYGSFEGFEGTVGTGKSTQSLPAVVIQLIQVLLARFCCEMIILNAKYFNVFRLA